MTGTPYIKQFHDLNPVVRKSESRTWSVETLIVIKQYCINYVQIWSPILNGIFSVNNMQGFNKLNPWQTLPYVQ